MTRPRILDLFCGPGGAAIGYWRSGFEVVGVDIKRQPHYQFEFHQADAMTYPLEGFDFIHASPPCQRYIRSGTVNKAIAPDLLGPVRERLLGVGTHWVIENVPGAPMRADLTLCGSMFGLGVRRHRWFESNVALENGIRCDHSRPIVGVYGHPHGNRGAWPSMLAGTRESWEKAMGLPIALMTAREMSQAVPPAYTEFLGKQLIRIAAVAT